MADLEKNQRGAELDWTLSGLQGPRSIIDLSWPLQGFSAPLALNPGQQLTCEGQQSSRPSCAQALLGQDTGLEERRREDLKRPMHSAGPSRGCSVVFNLQTHLILFIHVENFKGGLHRFGRGRGLEPGEDIYRARCWSSSCRRREAQLVGRWARARTVLLQPRASDGGWRRG